LKKLIKLKEAKIIIAEGRKRHPLQYEAVFSESKEEVKGSIFKAEKLVRRIEEHLNITATQRLLF